MYRTSDDRHLFNRKLRNSSCTVPKVQANPKRVSVRRSIEAIQEQRRLKALFEL
ncbi:PA3496 family putative envelope integrity protein [Vibrio cholerae]